ncbi:MAG: ABC transporter substrate-binding protein [Clostridiaceae bacterium]|nr:ABC transporter substrate-binding protein [Clostridiaceae bacterium]
MNGVLNVVKIKFIHIAAVILIISLVGCTSTSNLSDGAKEISPVENTSGFPMVITDSYNRQVRIDKEPQRVISIAPNITEIIFALNMSDKLIGRSEYCDWPEEVKDIASVGLIDNPSIEKIIELKPDLVLVSTHFKKEIVEKLETLGVNVAAFYGDENFEGVYETIQNVGIVLNAKDEAQKLVAEMKAKVQDVLERVKDRPRPSVYYAVSFGKEGDYTAGKGTFIGQMIEMAGGKNAADDVEGWAYSLEKLVEKDPDIIICSKYFNSKQGIENTNGYKDLRAVKEGRLFEIDNNLLDRQGVRQADGLIELAKIIHPEAFR